MMTHRPPAAQRLARRVRPGRPSVSDATIIAATIGPRPPARWRYRAGIGPIQPKLARTAGNQSTQETAYARPKNHRTGRAWMERDMVPTRSLRDLL